GPDRRPRGFLGIDGPGRGPGQSDPDGAQSAAVAAAGRRADRLQPAAAPPGLALWPHRALRAGDPDRADDARVALAPDAAAPETGPVGRQRIFIDRRSESGKLGFLFRSGSFPGVLRRHSSSWPVRIHRPQSFRAAWLPWSRPCIPMGNWTWKPSEN